MKNTSQTLKDFSLFRGLNEDEIEEFLLAVKAYKKTYSKGELIYLNGEQIKNIAIVLSGKIYIENFDLKGNKVIISCFEKGGHFGDVYALTSFPIMVDVSAGDDTEVLFIDKSHLLNRESISRGNVNIILNLLNIIAKKNMNLSRKIINTSPKTIRARLMSYLREESIINKSNYFDIPYDRQALSEYLNCDRAQLSKELSKMKKEGLLDYNKNTFRISF